MSDETEVSPLPVMALQDVEAWGVAQDGSAAQFVVKTATQKIMLHVSAEQLLKVSANVRAASYQAQKNAKAAGVDELVEAVMANTFMVGGAPGVDGVLLVIDSGLPTEVAYAVRLDDATAMGRLLQAESQKRRTIKQAVRGVAKPPKRRLILPGDMN